MELQQNVFFSSIKPFWFFFASSLWKIQPFYMRYHFFLHYGWFLQNLGKKAVLTFMHTTVNGLDWQCCLTGGSKTAPRIFICPIVLVAKYLSYVKSFVSIACLFFWYIISVLASVHLHLSMQLSLWTTSYEKDLHGSTVESNL